MTVSRPSIDHRRFRPRGRCKASYFFVLGWDDREVWGDYVYSDGRHRKGRISWETLARDWVEWPQ